MEQRQKLLRIYGSAFCADEATAVVRMLQMIAHETEIASAAVTLLVTAETKEEETEEEEKDGKGKKVG